MYVRKVSALADGAGDLHAELKPHRLRAALTVEAPIETPVAHDVQATVDLWQIRQCAVTTSIGQG